MASLIDWYLVELQLRLNRSLPTDRIDEIVKEAEMHLRESVRNRLSPGVTEVAAIEGAIEAYGLPDRVARGFLRGVRLKFLAARPGLWAMLGALIVIYCWNFPFLILWGYFDVFGETWEIGVAALVGIGGLALIALAASAGLKSNWLSIASFTVFAAIFSIPLMSFWMIPAPDYYSGISRFHLSRDESKVVTTVSRLKAYEAYLGRGMSTFASAKSPADLPLDMRNPAMAAVEFGMLDLQPHMEGTHIDPGGAYVVPRGYGVFAEVDGRISAIESIARFEEAKRVWLKDGAGALKRTQEQRKNMEALLARAYEADRGRLFFPVPELWTQTVTATLFILPLLLMVDAVSALRARPKRRWPNRALA